MTDSLAVGVVTGVTPDKWVRAWHQRMRGTALDVVALTDGEVAAALVTRVDAVLARLPVHGVDQDTLHIIPLWEETPVVVAGRDHPVRLFDTVTLAEIADEARYEGWDDATLDIVAAGHGVATMPQAVLRATGRRDVVGRPITDAEPTRIGLVWLRTAGGPLVDEFVGIVRGRTSNSSRGPATAAEEPKAKQVPRKPQARRPAQQAGRGRPRTGRR